MKSIKGYEGIYSIGADSVVTIHERTRSDGRVYPQKSMRSQTSKSGYKTVALVKDGCMKRVYVHRLVAQAYIPNPLNMKTVNHKNGNKSDNRLENLEWVSYSENTKHSFSVLGRTAWNKGKFKVRPEMMCEWCGVLFTPTRNHQILCSRKCTARRNGNIAKRKNGTLKEMR